MTNIPTDLLRTLVAVVDLRSFTKAAISFGVSQPAVSSQIKRLQSMLGGELFDRRSQGISLTPHGEKVVSYARRLLSINDQIVHLANGPRPELVIRVGTSSDYIGSVLTGIMAQFRARFPDVRFILRTDNCGPLERELRSGELDVLIGLSLTPPHDARHSHAMEIVWGRAPRARINFSQPVPLVSYGDSCVFHQLAAKALNLAGLEWEDVFTGTSVASLDGAVAAGLGIMAMTPRRIASGDFVICDDASLPKLPDLYSGIFVREGGAGAIYDQLADDIAAAIYPPAMTAAIKAETAA